MTEGEITFHLREICPHWAAPRITSETATELRRRNLIEFSEDTRLVRLTPDGVQRKLLGRITTEDSTINSVRTRDQRQQKKRVFARSRFPRR